MPFSEHILKTPPLLPLAPFRAFLVPLTSLPKDDRDLCEAEFVRGGRRSGQTSVVLSDGRVVVRFTSYRENLESVYVSRIEDHPILEALPKTAPKRIREMYTLEARKEANRNNVNQEAWKAVRAVDPVWNVYWQHLTNEQRSAVLLALDCKPTLESGK